MRIRHLQKKLRDYVQFKYEYGVEPNVSDLLNRQHSIIIQIRCIILQIKIDYIFWQVKGRTNPSL